MRSLINYDPSNKLIDSSQPAGGSANLLAHMFTEDREEVQAGLFYARKRMDMKKKTEMRIGSNDPTRSGRRKIESITTPEGIGAQSLSVLFQRSNQVSQIISDKSEPPVLLSHAQVDMRRGKLGSNALAENIKYTSEQRMLREQVLAALRKLDGGELSSVEFQDKMFAMRVELPAEVLQELHLYEQSGLLDWSACVHAIDGYVFRHKSVEQTDDSAGDEISALKNKLIEAIFKKKGPSGLSDITMQFQAFDIDRDSSLSYNEFIRGCELFGLHGISSAEYRAIFNHFDKNGDGNRYV